MVVAVAACFAGVMLCAAAAAIERLWLCVAVFAVGAVLAGGGLLLLPA